MGICMQQHALYWQLALSWWLSLTISIIGYQSYQEVWKACILILTDLVRPVWPVWRCTKWRNGQPGAGSQGSSPGGLVSFYSILEIPWALLIPASVIPGPGTGCVWPDANSEGCAGQRDQDISRTGDYATPRSSEVECHLYCHGLGVGPASFSSKSKT